MAQFGKHFFGSSYFGRTSTFDGVYQTEVVDAGEPFTGKIHLEVLATLPSVSYDAAGKDLVFTDRTKWTFSGKKATTRTSGTTIQLLACASRFDFRFDAGAGRGAVSITIKKIETQVETTHTLDTATAGSLVVNKDYGDYLVTITTSSALPVTIQSINARVTHMGAEVRTASTWNQSGYNWSAWTALPLSWNAANTLLIGDSPSVTNRQYVQLKLHLSTSDADATPFVDKINFSSGDINKYAENGYWYAAIDMTKVASEKTKTFKRLKRVEWQEEEKKNSQMTIRSTSTKNTGMPADLDVLNPTYWQAETAPYKVLREGSLHGIPYGRISLGQANNGGFSQTQSSGYVIKGPFSTEKMALANTKILKWLEWHSRYFYPTIQQGISVSYEFYPTFQDAAQGRNLLGRISQPELVPQKNLPLENPNYIGHLYLRIVFNRPAGRQSPVVDQLDLSSSMRYESIPAIDSFKKNLCGLENINNSEETGLHNLGSIPSSRYNWPSLSQELEVNRLALTNATRRVQVSFTPRYANQVSLGIGKSYQKEQLFSPTQSVNFPIYAKASVSEPSLSSQDVSAGQLFWHYNYDGGTVGFENTAERDLANDFTPNLLKNKKYRFFLKNGWRQETFQTPTSLTWEELAEMMGVKKEELMAENPNLKLYNGKIPQLVTIKLPNNTVNPLIVLAFQSSKNLFTEKSIHNNNGNDTVEASIPSQIEKEMDWTSEEVIYDGVLNQNDEFSSYVRTQFAGGEKQGERLHTVTKNEETLAEIALLYGVSVADLRRANQNPVNDRFKKGQTCIVPGVLQLPEIDANVYYTGVNPYVIEIVPGTVRKSHNQQPLEDHILTLGSDDEPGVQYTTVESGSQTMTLVRGSLPHGRDIIPFSNVIRVSSIKNKTTGVTYSPYQKTGTSQMGDYIISKNVIDWSPTHSGSKEPAAGDELTVVFTYGIIDTLRVIVTSDYKEQTSRDRLWRSRDIFELEGIVTPDRDLYLPLPEKESFRDWRAAYKDTEYVVEDNDLWVQTSIKEVDGQEMLFATLNGEDPKRNWYPTIQNGFYYLNDQEYYLYSEPSIHTYGREHIPIIKDAQFSENGMKLG